MKYNLMSKEILIVPILEDADTTGIAGQTESEAWIYYLIFQ